MVTRQIKLIEQIRREQAERQRRVKELYDLGTKDADIAMILGLTESQVRHARKCAGLPSHHRAYLEKLTPGEKAELPIDEVDIDLRALVYGLHADGFAIEVIAARAGKPLEIVAAIAAEMPKGWRAWGKANPQYSLGLAYRNQLAGSRRGGGKKMVP